MNMYGSLYSNLRVYYSRDFPKFIADETIDLTEQSYEKNEENKQMD